jgi:hypothetical protein
MWHEENLEERFYGLKNSAPLYVLSKFLNFQGLRETWRSSDGGSD